MAAERYPRGFAGNARPLVNDAPAGWLVFGNTLVPDTTIAGYLARGEEFRGGCRTYGCRRTYWLDPMSHAERHLLALPASTLRRMLQCNRPDGCSFEIFAPRPDQSVRLTVLSGRPNVRVKIKCPTCAWMRLRKAEDVIAVLMKDRTGSGSTLVHEVGPAMAKKPCPKCKAATTWAAEVVWLRTDTMIWRVKGEQLFDEMT